MKRFDAAIIGGGPEGLVAAITLARAGFSVIIVEKQNAPGGRATTREFHPGFRVSPYTDELPAIPSRLYRKLNLARHGAILAPSPASVLISESGTSLFFADAARSARTVPAAARSGFLAFREEVETLRRAVEERVFSLDAPAPRRWYSRSRGGRSAPWPIESWARASLRDVLRARIPDSLLRLHLAADAVSGRAVSPFLAGTALHALAPGVGLSGSTAGGLGRLGRALVEVATQAGVVIRCDAEVTEIGVKRGRATGILVGSEDIDARAFLSTLDVKRTMLGLIASSELPASVVKRVGHFRMAGQGARVLFALDAAPDFALAREIPDAASGPIHVLGSMKALTAAHELWRAGRLADAPPVTLRLPGFADPRLAPIGKAVMTATISAVPSRMSGGWEEPRREQLGTIALAAAERAIPGVTSLVLAQHVIVGTDVEQTLGATEGDLDGGEIAADQVLDSRPLRGAEWRDGRTPIASLFLAGSSPASPFVLGAAGERAARAIIADLKTGTAR
jgi:phytoene dehydrogenase-like protein